MTADPSLFARIGEGALRAVVADFYERVFRDVMIGFMFQGKDKARLVRLEWELAAAMLGAPGVKYTGRPMRAAHAQTPIFGGQFERRLELLRQTMRDHKVDDEIQRVWIDHALSLRAQVTRDRGSECEDTSVVGPRLAVAPPTPDPDAKIQLGRRNRP